MAEKDRYLLKSFSVKKFIGIYNRYWNSCGGGEKHVGSLAETLSANPENDVCLIGIEAFSTAKLSAIYKLDLSKCRTQIWPDDYGQQTLLSQGFDLFINSTYCSPLSSLARKSVYFCFFPQNTDGIPLGAQRWLSEVRARFVSPKLPEVHTDKIVLGAGHYDVEADGRCWFGGLGAFYVSRNQIKGSLIELPIHSDPRSSLIRVKVDRQTAKWNVQNGVLKIEIPFGFRKKKGHHIFVESRVFSPIDSGESNDTRTLGFCLNLSAGNSRGIQLSQLRPHWLDNYGIIIANSSYTASWIKKRWGRKARILEPSIDLDTFSSEPKAPKRQKVILTVGRFFWGGHNKKHDVMIGAFKQMVDSGVIDNTWKLVLAGARHREMPQHLTYFEELERSVKGYNIELKPDIPFKDLLHLYQSSAIYWHAAGYGESQEENPERFEHFGITTCEAMASGVLPIVINSAGQKEIVKNGVNGYTFETVEELIVKTRKAIESLPTPQFKSMLERSRESIKRYSIQSFRSKVRQILGP